MSKNVIVIMIVISVVLVAAIALLFYRIIGTPVKAELSLSPQVRNPAGESAVPNKETESVKKIGDEESVVRTAEATISKDPDSPKAEPAYFILAASYDKNGDLIKAKETYQKIIDKFPGSNNIRKADEALENLNIKILFSPIITQDFISYEVKKGDTLTRLAKTFGTTTEFIIRANDLKDNMLRVGKKLKLPKMKFSIVVDKSQNILTLKSASDIIKTYRVSTGKNSSTPVGTFKITNKIIDPPWYPPQGGVIPAHDPRNVLGSRWMGLSKPSYGIHGTIDPASIGKSVTEGCIRMKNEDAEELYAIVPDGTEVIIVD